ncbi:septum formation initiator family protein, partial [Enterobacter hormaechei]|uniref:septum formation initiator family protein n=1 Tax=Enterobacter hormaechei TaxID=158836 RepID=UPI00203E26DF
MDDAIQRGGREAFGYASHLHPGVTGALLLAAAALLLGWLQYRFWFGPGNSGEVMMLEAQVANQERDNEGLQQRNVALA